MRIDGILPITTHSPIQKKQDSDEFTEKIYQELMAPVNEYNRLLREAITSEQKSYRKSFYAKKTIQ